MLSEITAEASFIRMEEEVRRFWLLRGVPEAFMAAAERSDDSGRVEPYVIYQQPLSVEQSEASRAQLFSTADLLTRYRTLRGEPVQRRVGWSCHGLPVEALVESSLGPDTVDYGLSQFSAACRDAAIEGIRHDEVLAEKLGAWLDPDTTYATLTTEAVGAVWGALHRLWTADRLREKSRLVHTCTRCATPLSDAEAARLLVRIETLSLWLQLPWDGEPDTYFLVWVPFPWMLTGMVALAAHPEARYVLVERKHPVAGEAVSPRPLRLVVAEGTLHQALQGDYSPVRQLSGRSLRGIRYRPAFTFVPVDDRTHQVVLSKEVPLDRGTGLQPVTPAFHDASLALARTHNLPVTEFLDAWSRLDESAGRWRGLTPLEAEPLLIDDLQARGLLFRRQHERHSRALCPYCEVPLLPTVRSVWQVETSSGPWIISRDRIWGTPLPIWVCRRCGQRTCVAGIDDLAYRTGMVTEQIDPHRPAVDRLTFPCEACGGTMQRAVPVIDAAFDSAVLPWATAPQPGPAKVAIGFNHTRPGWLGNLAEVSRLVRGKPASSQAVALQQVDMGAAFASGHILSADAMRWAALSGTTAEQAERGVLRPLWRSVVQMLSESENRPGDGVRQIGTGGLLLDNWLLARLHQTTIMVAEALEICDLHRATHHLTKLVDDIVGWYVPQRSGGGSQALETLAQLLAPFVPHLAEVIYSEGGKRATDSVHLSNWPSVDRAWPAASLLQQMETVQRLAALGQEARARAKIERGQPLQKALFGKALGSTTESDELDLFVDLLAEALGVKSVRFSPDVAERVQWQLAIEPTRDLRQGITADQINSLLAALSPEIATELASQLRAGLSVRVEAEGQGITLLPDEVVVTAQAGSGWAAASDTAYLLLLQTD